MAMFTCSNGNFSLIIDDLYLKELKNLYNESVNDKKEFGGLLIGRYNSEGVLITNFTILENISKKPSCNFEYGPSTVTLHDGEKVIGNWHTHPNNSPNPSKIDKDEMLRQSNGKKSNKELILLILGKDHKLSISAHTINGLFYLN